MWSSPLLALLLLLAMVVHTTVSAPPPSTVPNRTLPYPDPLRVPRGETMTLVQELLGSDPGRKRTLKSLNGQYLVVFNRKLFTSSLNFRDWRSNEPYWHFEQINDYEVALWSAVNGQYLGHSYRDYGHFAREAKEWEMLTPVKNDDGSWSFKSRWNKFMVARHPKDLQEGYQDIYFAEKNGRYERWLLN